VGSAPKSDVSVDRSKIAAVRKALNEAVKHNDVRQLVDLMTNDVVVVQTDGQCRCGKQEVETFFQHAFARFDLEGTISSREVIVHDKWAVEIDQVEITIAPFGAGVPFGAGAPTHVQIKLAFIFGRQPDASWKVARLVRLPE
jgi:uncharacterized protein (TIGR02246 family)